MDGLVNIVADYASHIINCCAILTKLIITRAANTVGKNFQPSVGA